MKSANIHSNLTYDDNKPSVSLLFETSFSKEIRILFKKGQHMKKHKTQYPISVEMVEGELTFGVEDETHNLKKGDILGLDGGIAHDLLAESDCIVRLSLNTLDKVSRVINVASS